MSAYYKPVAHPNNFAQNRVLVEKHRVAIFSFLFLLLADKFQFFLISIKYFQGKPLAPECLKSGSTRGMA
jgi:hypothetical protein